MKDDEKVIGREHLLERMGLPSCAVEAYQEQRRTLRGELRQKVRLAGWIGALVLLAGVAIGTAHQYGLLGGSHWWRAIGWGLFVVCAITLSLSARFSYWREQLFQSGGAEAESKTD